jgi:hypothetical protein
MAVELLVETAGRNGTVVDGGPTLDVDGELAAFHDLVLDVLAGAADVGAALVLDGIHERVIEDALGVDHVLAVEGFAARNTACGDRKDADEVADAVVGELAGEFEPKEASSAVWTPRLSVNQIPSMSKALRRDSPEARPAEADEEMNSWRDSWSWA